LQSLLPSAVVSTTHANERRSTITESVGSAVLNRACQSGMNGLRHSKTKVVAAIDDMTMTNNIIATASPTRIIVSRNPLTASYFDRI
jgi:hypothetical protein